MDGNDTNISSQLLRKGEAGQNGEPGPTLPITFLELEINITTPSHNAILGSSVTVMGTASCTHVTIHPVSGARTETNAPNLMKSVRVQFGSGSFQQATRQGSTWEQWRITRSRGSGPLTLTARIEAEETDGTPYSTTDVVTVQVDATGPSLEVTTPPNETTFTWNGSGVPVTIGGTASDTLSGVSVVEWDLNEQGQFSAATPQSLNNWSTWTAALVLDAPGEHLITVRAEDGHGNASPRRYLTLNVAVVFEPKDPDDVVSMAVYLDDLQNFASQRAKSSASGPALDRALLKDTFHQPFDALTNPINSAVAKQPVHQVRLCIEVLRKYLGEKNISVPVDAQSSYVHAAYHNILRQLGTSYEELRLARVADAATRATLASRLGIDLSPSRPDELDSLVLELTSATEDDLQRLFGIEDSSRDAIEAGVIAEPELLTWRLMYLRALWQNQDADAPFNLDNLGLIIDPDVIGESDFRDAMVGNPAYDLWQQRQSWVAGKLTELRVMRQGQTSDLAGFDAIASHILGPVNVLVSLADQHQQGEDIQPQLAAQQLSLKPFLYLMRIRELAASAPSPAVQVVLDTEWDDLYSVLVQVQKIRESSNTWRDEEFGPELDFGAGRV